MLFDADDSRRIAGDEALGNPRMSLGGVDVMGLRSNVGGTVLEIVLDRPDKKNAINRQMWRGLPRLLGPRPWGCRYFQTDDTANPAGSYGSRMDPSVIADRGRWMLSSKPLEVARHVGDGLRLREVARPIMTELASETGEGVHWPCWRTQRPSLSRMFHRRRSCGFTGQLELDRPHTQRRTGRPCWQQCPLRSSTPSSPLAQGLHNGYHHRPTTSIRATQRD